MIKLGGDAVAEWSKALLPRVNKRKKDPKFAPSPPYEIF